MIRTCREFGVEATRVDGRSGVWVLADDRGPDRKLGAIGVRVSRQVTMHGFALNCDADLSWADNIVACGIDDAGVSTITREAGRPVTVQDVLPYAEKHLYDVLASVPASPEAPRFPALGPRLVQLAAEYLCVVLGAGVAVLLDAALGSDGYSTLISGLTSTSGHSLRGRQPRRRRPAHRVAWSRGTRPGSAPWSRPSSWAAR